MLIACRGAPRPFCDGLSRRTFLKIGGLAVGGLALPDILRAEDRPGPSSHKSVIMVYLPGGPPHLDFLDPKPNAPAEVRGSTRAIPTNVPGVQLSEYLPRLARMMDKLAVIRSVVGCKDEHTATACLSGFAASDSKQTPGGRPSVGAVLARLEGPVDKSVPPFVGLAPTMKHRPWADPGDAGFLGRAYAPFQPQGDGLADMTLNGTTLPDLEDRKALLNRFDTLRRDIDAGGQFDAADAYTKRALDVLTSSRLVDALDVAREDPRVRDRYGIGDCSCIDDGGPCWNDQFLIARRLVEVGVRCVTLAFGRWDFHNRNFEQCREYFPRLDQALSALIEDLHQRGLAEDVSVVAWGEFGRTPKINEAGGRDHWAQVSCALLAGGGLRTGQVVGATDRLGASAKDRPVHMQQVLATVYQKLGIDPRKQTVASPSGRPMFLLDYPEPIAELV
jgi:hypothetical protein